MGQQDKACLLSLPLRKVHLLCCFAWHECVVRPLQLADLYEAAECKWHNMHNMVAGSFQLCQKNEQQCHDRYSVADEPEPCLIILYADIYSDHASWPKCTGTMPASLTQRTLASKACGPCNIHTDTDTGRDRHR